MRACLIFLLGLLSNELDLVSEVRITISSPMSFDKNLFVSPFGILLSSDRRCVSDDINHLIYLLLWFFELLLYQLCQVFQ